MEQEIYLASENPEKIRVVEHAWKDHGRIKTPGAMAAIMPGDLETGTTYEQNAYAKAMWLFRQTGCTTIADDSGMEIAGLNGNPGVLTRRWAGESSNEEALMEKTVHAISRLSESERVCDFVICAAAIIDVRHKICVVEKDTGVLLLSSRGVTIPGHPLASLLWIPKLGATLAELRTDLQFESKDLRAHRKLRTEILNIL